MGFHHRRAAKGRVGSLTACRAAVLSPTNHVVASECSVAGEINRQTGEASSKGASVQRNSLRIRNRTGRGRSQNDTEPKRLRPLGTKTWVQGSVIWRPSGGVSGVESVSYVLFTTKLLAHEQQIHLSKAKMGCQHAPGAQFLANKRMGTPCVACRVLLRATPLGPA